MTKGHIARVLGSAAVAGLAAALLVPGAAASAPQDGRFIAASKDRAIPNSYIVVFKDTASLRATATVGNAARELSRKHGAKLGRTYAASVRGFSATVSEAKAREIDVDDVTAAVKKNVETAQAKAVEVYGDLVERGHKVVDKGAKTEKPAPAASTTATASTTPAAEKKAPVKKAVAKKAPAKAVESKPAN